MAIARRRAIALFGGALVIGALAACKGEERETTTKTKSKSASTLDDEPTAPPASAASSTAPGDDAPRPRYLRPNAQGELVDAFRFPSVPASMVEKEVVKVKSRRGAAAILRRFGVNPSADRPGEVWIAKASLVDGLERERLLVVTFLGDLDEQGLRDEDDWLVFLGSTEDDRLIGLGSAGISAKTHDGAPVLLEARELHSAAVDDVVATWSSCANPTDKACHGLRVWTMERGRPEKIVDVMADAPPSIEDGEAPHVLRVDGKVLTFDAQSFTYR